MQETDRDRVAGNTPGILEGRQGDEEDEAGEEELDGGAAVPSLERWPGKGGKGQLWRVLREGHSR